MSKSEPVDQPDRETVAVRQGTGPRQTVTVLIVSLGAWLIVSPLATTLGFVALPGLFWGLLAILLLCYVILTQIVKTWFYRRYPE